MNTRLTKAFLFSVSVLLAQHCSAAGSSSTKFEVVSAAGCPVRVEVRQQMIAPRVLVKSPGKDSQQPYTGTHPAYTMDLHAEGDRFVTGGTVELVGTKSSAIMSLNQGAREALFREKLAFASASSELQANQLSAVRWIELKSVTYSDGSKWQAGGGTVCRVQPSLFVPVV